jgi:hypothetical protein
MPIITKPSTIDKNSPAEISLDKAALAAVSSVVADDYFSDSDNWKEVLIYYRSSTGNQREILKFNATVSSPTADFLVSDKALDIFEVQKIVIVDFDAGSITIPRSQLTTSEFDIDTSAAPALNELYFETISTGVTRSGNSINLPSSQSMSYGLDENSLGSGAALLDITFNLSNMSSGKNIRIGLTEGVDGITEDSGPASYTRFYILILDSNIVRFDVASNQQVILSSSIGSSLTFRIEQTSTQYRYYYNSTLIWTESIQYTLNAYKPFIRSNSTDVTCLATTLSGNAIIWEPISNSYNAEADGGLTNGAGRGGSTYYNAFSNTQTATAGGDIDITFNIGSFPTDTAFGFFDASESGPNTSTPTFCGIVAGGGGSRPHINNIWVSSAGDPSNKAFRITRIAGVVTMYIDSDVIYTTSVATAPNIKPIASLATSGGTLISSSVII